MKERELESTVIVGSADKDTVVETVGLLKVADIVHVPENETVRLGLFGVNV